MRPVSNQPGRLYATGKTHNSLDDVDDVLYDAVSVHKYTC